jgi:uncharacterized protein YjbJ (UPF0337 family)
MDTANAPKTTMQWHEIRGRIKQKWSKLVDTDVDSFKENLHLISEKLQKSYGFTKDKADQEYAEFSKGLEANVTPTEKAKPN